RRTFSYLLLGLIALAAPPARAEVDPVVEMKKHFDAGTSAYDQRNFEAAAREFRLAYDASPKAQLLFNEAVCYEKMRDYSKAANLFREYLNKKPDDKGRKDIEQRIAALDAAVKQPSKGPPVGVKELTVRGFVNIETKPPGDTIYLDDRKNEPLGQTPWNGPLEGQHKLIIVAPGYKDDEESINPNPSTITNVIVALSQQHYLGWIEVRSNVAAADVYLD